MQTNLAKPVWSPTLTTLLFFVGLAGGEMMVRGASTIARAFHLSPLPIGLTVVGFGTSLPELATNLVAAFRRHTEIAIGNIAGLTSSAFSAFWA